MQMRSLGFAKAKANLHRDKGVRSCEASPSLQRRRKNLQPNFWVHRGEAGLRQGEGRRCRKMTRGFIAVKKPLLQRRTLGWSIKLRIFSPSLAHFPMLINMCILDFFRVRFFRENTLLRVSPPFFLNHFRVCDFSYFKFGFGADIEDLAH